jgi:hypothetical protein
MGALALLIRVSKRGAFGVRARHEAWIHYVRSALSEQMTAYNY